MGVGKPLSLNLGFQLADYLSRILGIRGGLPEATAITLQTATQVAAGDVRPSVAGVDPNVLAVIAASLAGVLGLGYMATHKTKRIITERWDNQSPTRTGLVERITPKNKGVEKIGAALALVGLLLGSQLLPKTTGAPIPLLPVGGDGVFTTGAGTGDTGTGILGPPPQAVERKERLLD